MTTTAHSVRSLGPRKQAGLTLIELLMTLAVSAVATGAALPGFFQAAQTRHLDGVAAQLETDIQHTRSLAVSQHHTVRMAFSERAGGSCYVIHTGPAGACDCSLQGEAVCRTGATPLRNVALLETGPVRLSSNITSMVFDPIRGTNTPTATLKVRGRDGKAVHLIVNIMGRVRSCSPAGLVRGYAAC